MVDCHALCAEAGRRRLIAAIPALEALCRRFKGFGLEHAVPEQIAALRGLAAISTREAAAAVSRIIAENVVQGPGLHDAVRAAVLLECRLSPAVSLPLLRHKDARVRAAACRVARTHADVMPVLVDLLDDLHRLVAVAAACALGRAGRVEAQPALARLLRDEPTAEVDAVSPLADDDCIVQLGRSDQPRVVGRGNRCSGCNGQSASTGHRCDGPAARLSADDERERGPGGICANRLSWDKVERRFDRMCATVAVTNLPTSKEKSDFRSVWHRGSTPGHQARSLCSGPICWVGGKRAGKSCSPATPR